jgi:hypothetical protein
MKPHQINILAAAVLCNLQQIQNPKKPRLARQLSSNVGKPDRFDRVYFDCASLYPIPRAYANARRHPKSDAASNFSPAHSLTQPLGKRHLGPLALSASRRQDGGATK